VFTSRRVPPPERNNKSLNNKIFSVKFDKRVVRKRTKKNEGKKSFDGKKKEDCFGCFYCLFVIVISNICGCFIGTKGGGRISY
jgi:hypothetical protein